MDVDSPLAHCAFQLNGNVSCYGEKLSPCPSQSINASMPLHQTLRAGVIAPVCGARGLDQSWRSQDWTSAWGTALDFVHWD